MQRGALDFLFSLLLSLLLGSPAIAALTEVDDLALPGALDGFNLTQDDVTGLEWLDLTLTAGRTVDDIVGNDGTDELGPGGDFEGFRYATKLEVTGWTATGQVDSLFSNFGLNSTFSSIGSYPFVFDYMSYVGCFSGCGTYSFVQGICVDEIDPQQFHWFPTETFPSQGQDFGSLQASTTGPVTSTPVNGSVQTIGHFLVRPVPEPGALVALVPGLAMLAWLRRRASSRTSHRP
jgi:hypothetical protein